jgi:hypothetical protein
MNQVKELIEQTTAHGIPNLVRKKSLLIKIIWTICIILCINGLIIILYKSVKAYLKYEVVTNINVHDDVNPEFPTISFCFNNDVQGNSINKTILKCHFKGIPCNLTEFQIYFSEINEVICYRFNTGKDLFGNEIPIKSLSRNDPTNGLKIYFYNRKHISDPNVKATIYIQNHSKTFNLELPIQLYCDCIQLPAGVTRIKVTREMYHKLTLPYNNCIKQNTNEYISEIFQHFKKLNYSYTKKDCINLCLIFSAMDECDNDVESYCYAAFLLNFEKNVRKNQLLNYCSENCPSECDYINFKTNSFYTGLISSKIYERDTILSRSKIPLDHFKKDGIFIDIHYDSSKYKIVNQLPKLEFIDLIANIGNNLELFIGISFLSYIELIELFFCLFKLLFSKLTTFIRGNA